MSRAYSSPTSVGASGFPPPPPYGTSVGPTSPMKARSHAMPLSSDAPPYAGPSTDVEHATGEYAPNRAYNPAQHRHNPAPPPYGYAPPPPYEGAAAPVPGPPMMPPPPPSYEEHIMLVTAAHHSRHGSPSSAAFRTGSPRHDSPTRAIGTPTSTEPPAYNSRFRHDPYSPDGTPRVLSPAPRAGQGL